MDSISPEALQRALDRSIALFPGFNVKLRSGLFWHYLEPADEVPQVEPERLPICAGLHADLNSVLMRVTYFRHRINLEVSHMISDGRGTLEFFKTLLNAYVVERYHATPALPSEPASTPERRNEDSYTTNYERSKAGATESEKVYHLFGWKNTAEPTFMEYHLSASAVHSAAKNMGVSVTSLVIAAVIVAIRATMPPSKRDRAIRMDVRSICARSSGRKRYATSSGLRSSATLPAVRMLRSKTSRTSCKRSSRPAPSQRC